MRETWDKYAIVMWYESQLTIQPLSFTNIDLQVFHVVTTICSWKFHYAHTRIVTDLFLLYFWKYDSEIFFIKL